MDEYFDDPIGRAVYNYHFNSINKPIIVHSENFDDDEIETTYLFRTYKQMPALEKRAINLCRGKILDIGACAGVHSVYLQKKGFDVVSLEKSALCCEVLKSRSLRNVIQEDIFSFEKEKFDTIMLLMNGTGIAGTLSGLDILLFQLKKILNPEGQILIDSSDLIYLFEEDDGSAVIDINSESYYGEMVFQTEYDNGFSQPFPWLYVDIDNLKNSAEKNLLKIANIYNGQHYDYLARITHKN